jgi:phage I-like protein
MEITNPEQKKIRLKKFLQKLSEDPSLSNQDELVELRSLTDILILTGYHPKAETVDMAELLSQLLRKSGIEANSEDMMESVMQGRSIDNFMKTGKKDAELPPSMR